MKKAMCSGRARVDVVLVDLTDSPGIAVHDVGQINHGYLDLAAYLRRYGVTVSIVSAIEFCGVTFDRVVGLLADRIAQLSPWLLGFSPYQPEYRGSNDVQFIRAIVLALRRRRCHPQVVLGGHYATFNHRLLLQDLPWVEYVVRGEGEQTVLGLVREIKGRQRFERVLGLTFRHNGAIVSASARPAIENLDDLPLPALDHLDIAARVGLPVQAHYIGSSRGCPGHCTFCSIHSFYRFSPSARQWRPKSAKRVVDEIVACQRKHPCEHIRFLDDNFIGPGEEGRRRALSIADEITRRRLQLKIFLMCRPDSVDLDVMRALRRAGLESVAIGVESASAQCLKAFAKGINAEVSLNAIRVLDQLGIMVHPSFIFLMPYSRPADIRTNLRFVDRVNRYMNVVWPRENALQKMVVFCGTPMHRRLAKDGLLRGNYLDGLSYRFRDRRMAYLERLCDAFAIFSVRMYAVMLDVSFQRLFAPERRQSILESLSSAQVNVCCWDVIGVARRFLRLLGKGSPSETTLALRAIRLWLGRCFRWANRIAHGESSGAVPEPPTIGVPH